MIEVLDFNLRGGDEAPSAAARALRPVERYFSPATADDVLTVVDEIVTWLSRGHPASDRLKLELSATSSVVRVAVTTMNPGLKAAEVASNRLLREALPATAALAPRYGIEVGRRVRIWAEFDRDAHPAPARRQR